MKNYILISSLIFVTHAAFGMDDRALLPFATSAAPAMLTTPPRTGSVRFRPMPQTSPRTKLTTAAIMYTTLQRGLEFTPQRAAALEKARRLSEKALATRDSERARQVREKTRGLNPDSCFDPESGGWYRRSSQEAANKINACQVVANTALWQVAHQDPELVDPVEAREVIADLARHDLTTLPRRTADQKRKIDPAQRSMLGFTSSSSEEERAALFRKPAEELPDRSVRKEREEESDLPDLLTSSQEARKKRKATGSVGSLSSSSSSASSAIRSSVRPPVVKKPKTAAQKAAETRAMNRTKALKKSAGNTPSIAGIFGKK